MNMIMVIMIMKMMTIILMAMTKMMVVLVIEILTIYSPIYRLAKIITENARENHFLQHMKSCIN